uniref:Uncharacterized protein n=1 Tax=Rhizophagus irregularis (strain DAOM 181602 / DAOM 197198 / MUCL 43194) TaxID=747089 RepID=U9SWH7_RHIID
MKPPSLEKDGTKLSQKLSRIGHVSAIRTGESDDPSLSVFSPFTCDIEIAICVFILGCWCESIRRQVWAPARKNITGPNGHGPVDFAIDLLQTAKTVGVAEVKDEDFYKGIAQNAVQLESALSNRKRKQVRWREELSEPVTVVYKDEDLQAKVEKVLGHMVIGRGAEAGLGF